MKLHAILFILAILCLSFFAFAHAGDVHEEETHFINSLPDPAAVIFYASVIIALVLVFTLLDRKLGKAGKKAAFAVIVASTVIATVYLLAWTVTFNTVSETGGPVHWHADFEIWFCGEQQTLPKPSDISNKVGTEILHHHDDNRIHVEGTLLSISEASLGNSFRAIGGELTENSITIPSDGITRSRQNGLSCPDGKEGELQVFIYKSRDGVFKQEKLTPENIPTYIMSPHTNIPPGDCIIIEFDKEKPRTEKLCTSYQLAVEKGQIREG